MNINIKLADGNEFISYKDYTYSYGGCPTCNYGSEFINEITIITTHYTIEIKLNQMYGYAFSQSDAIKIFATNLHDMSEDEFVKYIDEAFHKYNALEKFEVTRKDG